MKDKGGGSREEFWERQVRTPLLDALQECSRKPHTPFYAPGHKRGQGISDLLVNCLGKQVFQADLPELPELDNLFAPQGVIQAAQELAAEAFGAEQTWFLANGSTSGVVAAILATCSSGDKIVLPRNAHQSAIAGLILSGAIPIFVNPEYDATLDIAHCMTPQSVANALAEHPETKAVLLLSPTYDGVCGDVAAIAHLVHQYDIPLLVDEAHGAHFAFHPDLPTSALAAGADLVVQSTHKVLSALTQASMLHGQGKRVDRDRVSKALQLVQSTSPSYLLLASLDAARQQMATQGKSLMTRTLALADAARIQMGQIPQLSVLSSDQAGTAGFVELDRTRLTVTVAQLGLDGFTADEILHQTLGVTAEYPSLHHLTFIISLGNTEQDIAQLIQACQTLAAQPTRKAPLPHSIPPLPHSIPPLPLTPRQAFFSPTETVSIVQAVDRLSAELVCPYPPGIPILMPGERITAVALAYLQQVQRIGGFISGCADCTLQTLKVVRD